MPQRRSGKHGPCRLTSYLQIHSTVLNHLVDSRFAGDFTSTWTSFPDGSFWLEGFVLCKGRILVQYEKRLFTVGELEGEFEVQTEMYCYNAVINNVGNI